jgi:DNA-binding PadR family transcriptional regulator
LRGTLLETAILYQAAYFQDIYPYSLKKQLDIRWGDHSPPLPTIYSTINRLIKANFIQTKNEVINSRIQKKIDILDAGWVALERMLEELKTFLKVFEYHEKDLDFDQRRK